jgi:hypothetical protein
MADQNRKMRISTGHRSAAKIAYALALIGSAFAVDLASIKAARAAEVQGYPPSGFRKIETVVEAPHGKFRLEQWWKRGAAKAGQDLYQTWLVPKTGSPVRLPEVTLPKEWEVGDSGSVGFPSTFCFSPDGVYLFREQKIAHGVNGAYLYRRTGKVKYGVAVPDLYIRASKFFTLTTMLQWVNDTGIVEFSAWKPNDMLILKLRGYAEGRKFAVENWRCAYNPATSKFTVPIESTTTNKQTITPVIR